MINVKHPLNHCNEMQAEMISNTPQNERELHELIFSYGNAVYRYHALAKDFIPTEEDYKEWLDGLDETIKKGMEEKGFIGCLGVLSFTRYVNEKNDIGLDEFVEKLMGRSEFTKYKLMMMNLK